MNRNRVVLGMLIGLTALTAGSFSTSLAWYITSSSVSVENLEVKLKTEHNLLISTQKDGDYVSELGTKELKPSVGNFAPVSTMFESKWRDGKNQPEFYEYRGYYTPSSGIPYGPEKIETGFFTQTLYLLSDDDVYVTLDRDFLYVRAYEAANRKTAAALAGTYLYRDFTEEEIYERLNQVHKSMRFSFYFQETDQYFIVDPTKEGTTYYGGILDTFRDGYYDRYTGTDGVAREVVYGEYNDASLIRYGELLESDSVVEGELTCFNAAHHGQTRPFDAQASEEAGFKFKEEPSITNSDLSDDPDVEANAFAVHLARNVPLAFTLSIYLEGWDYDCVNAVMGASFLAGLQFKILREAY